LLRHAEQRATETVAAVGGVHNEKPYVTLPVAGDRRDDADLGITAHGRGLVRREQRASQLVGRRRCGLLDPTRAERRDCVDGARIEDVEVQAATATGTLEKPATFDM
jgi:hypothetical protein